MAGAQWGRCHPAERVGSEEEEQRPVHQARRFWEEGMKDGKHRCRMSVREHFVAFTL